MYFEKTGQSDLDRLHFLIEKNYQLEKECASLLKIKKGRPKKDEWNSEENFINRLGFVEIFEIEFFLIVTFILSRYKLVDYPQEISRGIDYNKLCQELEICSKTSAKKLVHHWQRLVSKNSYNFILNISRGLEDSSERIKLLEASYLKDEIGRHLIPCYEVTKSILRHAALENRAFKISVIRVNEDWTDSIEFMLQKNVKNGGYDLVYSESEKKNKPIIIFKGIVKYQKNINETQEEYIKRFVEAGIENIVLMNMAQHPQYAGTIPEEKKNNPYKDLDLTVFDENVKKYLLNAEQKFLLAKKLSEVTGCNVANSDLFLITHIRCDKYFCFDVNQSKGTMDYKEVVY